MTTPTNIATALYGPPKTLPTRAERPGETPCEGFQDDGQGFCARDVGGFVCGLPETLHGDEARGGKARG